MALFSDVDWIVILAVAAFLLFGSQGRETVRQLGRLYGRAMRFRQELVGEVMGSAGLPVGPDGRSPSLRAAILGDAIAPVAAPAAVASGGAGSYPGIVTQVAPLSLRTVETLTYGAAMGPGLWSVALTSSPGEAVKLR
jgi:hypothetical protein